MTSSDAKYVRLGQLGSLSSRTGRSCSRYRPLTKGCALLLFFLCFTCLFCASRIYLYSLQPVEKTPVVPQTCEGCNNGSFFESHNAGNRGTPQLPNSGDGRGNTLEDRIAAGREIPAEKTSAEKVTPQNLPADAESQSRSGAQLLKVRSKQQSSVHPGGSAYSARETQEGQTRATAAPLERDHVKKFFFYNPRPNNRDRADFDDCGARSACAMASSAEEADVILFNAARMKHVKSLPARRPNQIWVMYSREPTDLRSMDALDRPDLNNQVNYTKMIFSDSTWQVRYGTLEKTIPPRKDYEKIFRQKRYDVAWFVSHCDRPSRRMEYVRRMMSIIDVHIFGKCGNMTCGDRGYTMGGEKEECLQMLSDDYKFYLSFENTLCRDYVSEKFFNMFEGVDVIPVVRGGADYRSLFPSDIFINAGDFPSPESLGRYLRILGQNKSAYLEILQKKSRYKKHRLKLDFFCKLCESAHTGQPRHVYEDFYRWVKAPGNCWEPTDLGPDLQ